MTHSSQIAVSTTAKATALRVRSTQARTAGGASPHRPVELRHSAPPTSCGQKVALVRIFVGKLIFFFHSFEPTRVQF